MKQRHRNHLKVTGRPKMCEKKPGSCACLKQRTVQKTKPGSTCTKCHATC